MPQTTLHGIFIDQGGGCIQKPFSLSNLKAVRPVSSISQHPGWSQSRSRLRSFCSSLHQFFSFSDFWLQLVSSNNVRVKLTILLCIMTYNIRHHINMKAPIVPGISPSSQGWCVLHSWPTLVQVLRKRKRLKALVLQTDNKSKVTGEMGFYSNKHI